MEQRPDQPLPYEPRGAAISRRQYRLLIGLTLLNTILLAGFVVGPSVGPMVRGQWNQFQAARAQKRAERELAAAMAAAKVYAPPADLVILEERPDESAKLLQSDNARYQIIDHASIKYLQPRPWHAPVVLKEPADPKIAPLRMGNPIVFLHARQNGSRPQRLVSVQVLSEMEMDSPGVDDHGRWYHVRAGRTLTAKVIGDDGKPLSVLRMSLDDAHARRAYALWKKTDDQIEFQTKGLFRIYAGRADAADPSHFVIDYELDGKRAAIDGWLTETDTVRLQPREGSIVDKDARGRELTWDPYAPPAAK